MIKFCIYTLSILLGLCYPAMVISISTNGVALAVSGISLVIGVGLFVVARKNIF